MQRTLIRALVFMVMGGFLPAIHAQNITPKPTHYSSETVFTPIPTPTPIVRFTVPMQRVNGARLAAMHAGRIVFLENDDEKYERNRTLYLLEPGKKRLTDTGVEAVPDSVKISEDGRYMVFLHDELEGPDINGDQINQRVLRMYHFSTGRVLNLGIPARSATPYPGGNEHQYEYVLDGNVLAFSLDEDGYNSSANRDAPWNVIDMREILYTIEGTPTPTPSPTPVLPSPTPTPSVSPSPTPVVTPDPNTRARSDINQDGVINIYDLLIFQMDWKSPRPLIE